MKRSSSRSYPQRVTAWAFYPLTAIGLIMSAGLASRFGPQREKTDSTRSGFATVGHPAPDRPDPAFAAGTPRPAGWPLLSDDPALLPDRWLSESQAMMAGKMRPVPPLWEPLSPAVGYFLRPAAVADFSRPGPWIDPRSFAPPGGPMPFLQDAPAPFATMGAGGLVTQAEVDSLIAGLEQSLTQIETALIDEVFGENMPLLGNKLSQAASQALPALHQVTGLKNAVKSGLSALTGAPTYTKAQVEQAISTALSAASITAGAVSVDVTNPTDLKVTFNTTKAFPPLVLDLDGALGLPGLGLQTSGNTSTVFSYTLNLQVGVDSQGFYLNTANNASVFNVGFTTTLPGLDVSANLSRLRFRLTDESATDGDNVSPTSFTGTFGVDLLDPSGADNRLRVSELSADLLNAVFTGSAAINLNLASDLGSAKFPAISSDLNVTWNFSSAAVDPLDTNATFGAVPAIAFKNVTLDLGSFLTDFAKPVLEQVREVSEPVQPFVDAVKEPIPLLVNLHDLSPGIPTTMLEIAVKNGAITQAQADHIDVLAKVIEISQAIPANPGTGLKIDLGDFNLGASADPRVPNFNIAGITPNKLRTAAAAALQHPLAQEFLTVVQGFPKDAQPGKAPGKGMQFPILDKPETAFGLLLGKDVDLFTLDNDTQTFPLYTLNEFVPIARPLGFRFQGTGNVRVDMDFGFDTKGLLQFASSGDPAEILNGFYVKVPVDDQNQPISMAELNADFKASPAVNVVIGEIGAGGGLYAKAHATLADPNGDKHVYLDEFIDQFSIDPLCVLNADGALDFSLRAYASIGVSPIEKTFEYEFPVGTIFDFSFSCTDDPKPQLARIQSGDARLNIGPDAPLRLVGNIVDGAENFSLTHAGGAPGSEQISITYHTSGSSSDAIGALTYGPVSGLIRGDGGVDNDTIELAADILSPAQLSGNAGLDRLSGGAAGDTLDGGDDHDVMFGRGGNDTLLGGNGPDLLDGGPGADSLDGGEGTDTVSFATSPQSVGLNLTTNQHTGEAVGDTYTSIERFEGTAFVDTMIGSAQSDSFFGLAGNDTLNGGDGDDGLEGGAGADILIGGPGFDYTTYMFSPAAVDVNLLNLVSHGGDAEGDTLDGIEALIGSKFHDVLTGNADDNIIDGFIGNDTIDGGAGNDELHGGMESNAGVPVNDTLKGGPGNDRIFGDGSRDWADGGDGDDFIDMTFVAPYAPAGCEPPWEDDTILGGPGNDIILGSPHNDVIDAGEGDDFVSGGGGRVTPPPCPTPPGYIFYPKWESQNGVFRFYGMGGDRMDGGPGNDTVSFEKAAIVSNPDGNAYGVSVNLGTGALGNAAWESTIANFENVVGTDFQDSLTGSDGPNIFWPLRGGGASAPFTGGPDYIDGGAGVDTLVIDFSLNDDPGLSGVSGPGATQFGRTGTAGVRGDSYSVANIERYHITGAGKNDTIYAPANGHDDILIGNGGDDFLGGRGGSDTLLGGEGNDSITANGAFNFDRYGVTDGRDVLEGGPGDDVIENVAFEYATGRPMLAAGAISQIDGGPGFDKISFNFSAQTVPMVWNSAAPTNLEFPNGEYARNFEAIDTVLTGPGDDTLTQLGRVNNSIYTGPGNDVINPGIGVDYVNGGDGDDLVIVDWSVGDDATVGGVSENSGYRRYLAAAPFTQVDHLGLAGVERVHFTGTSKGDTLYGGGGNSVLLGNAGDDTLTCYGGDDTVEGGDGNDLIRGGWPNGPSGNDQLHGGNGNDTIYARDGYNQFSNTTVTGGPGNDRVFLENVNYPGLGYGNDTVDLGEGDDELTALWFDWFNGNAYAVTGNIQRLDGGPGIDVGSADFANQSQAITFIDDTNNSFDFPDGSYYRNFEHLRYFNSGSGNDRFTLSSRRESHDVSCRGGNDWINPGLGVDRIFGGAGEDTLFVDWSQGDEASLSGAIFNGNYIVRTNTATGAVVDQLSAPEFEHFHFTGSTKGDVLIGTDGSDILKGMAGSDNLRTYGGDDLLVGCDPANGRGAGEVDQITGDGGADIFVLGDATGRFYDDGDPSTQGAADYAKITDFTPSQDRLKLFGPASSYLIGPSPIAGVSGSALFHDSNGNGTLDPTDELMATLGTAAITVANTLAVATSSTAPPTLADMGVSGFTAQGGGPGSLTLALSLNATVPPDRALVLEATADLTSNAWQAVATKTGSAAWIGPATAVAGAVTGGRQTVIITPPQPAPRQFYRLRMAAM